MHRPGRAKKLLVAACAAALLVPAGMAAPGHAQDDTGSELGGDVWLTTGQLLAMRERVEQGQEPAASAAELLFDEVEGDLTREPDPPQVWFVPAFYQDPDGHYAQRERLMHDVNGAYRLALAYHLTDDPQYASKAAEFIAAWTTEVSEFRTTQDSRLVFSNHAPTMISAASLLRDTDAWSDELEADFNAFLDHTVPLLNTMAGQNNWGNWGMLFVMSAAAYQRDEAAFATAVERWQQLLTSQVGEQGHLPLEVTRNNGLGTHGIWYSHFTLQPQSLAAEIAAVNGVDLYSYESSHGRTLEMATRPVAGWVADPETFPYLDDELTVDDLSSVRRINRFAEQGIAASTISYFELTQGRWHDDAAASILTEDRPLTSVHSIPHLTLTHGGVTCELGELVCGEVLSALAESKYHLEALLTSIEELHDAGDLSDDQASALRSRTDVVVATVGSAIDKRRAGDDGAALRDVERAITLLERTSDWIGNQEREGELAAETATLLQDQLGLASTQLAAARRIVLGVTASLTPATAQAAPGETVRFTARLRNGGPRTLTRIALSLAPPNGWTVEPDTARTSRLAPGESFTTEFELQIPATEAGGRGIAITGTAAYGVGAGGDELPLDAVIDVGMPVVLGVDSSYNAATNPPSNLLDGDTATWWASAETPMPHWVDLQLDAAVEVGEVVVHARTLEPPDTREILIHDFDLESAQGDDPLTVLHSVRDNEDIEIAMPLEPAITADRIRVTVHRETLAGEPRDFADLAEIELYDADGRKLELIERPPEPSEPAQYSADFSDYPVGEPPADWTVWWRQSNWEVLDDPPRLHHTVDTDGRRALTWDQPGTVVGDVEVFAMVRGQASNTLFTLPLHVSGDEGSENAYYVDARQPQGLLRINRYLGGDFVQLGSAPFGWEEDVWYRVLFRREGDTLRAKIWPDGDDEPDWMVTATDPAFDQGAVGVGGFQDGSVSDWAFVGVGVGGEPAPRAP